MIFEELLSGKPQDPHLQRNAALGHKYIAPLLITGGDLSQGELHLRRAEEIDEKRVRANPSSRQARLDLSFDYSQDGTFNANRRHDYPAALASFERALAIRQELSKSDPHDVQLLDRTVYLHQGIANALLALKRSSEARSHAVTAVRIATELVAQEGSPHHRELLASTYNTLGQAETAGPNPAAACARWSKARALLEGMGSAAMTPSAAEELRIVLQRLAACR